jgi:hypothetical protein
MQGGHRGKAVLVCAGHVGHAASATREAQQVVPNLRIFQLANTSNYVDLFGSPLLAISNTKESERKTS